ncbi:TIR domain-containing protein [Paenibacillus maysiensis]|uniref:TIR domain-containing protein n=1 Tax=Paenibacillus maysiensis TaxID=1155954 RepID=UPI00046F826F|nr:TIR domain-containing protein [Paenibacillus maysiensis]
MQEFKTPLNIYVGWHHEFNEGLELAENIFTFFNRDVNDSFSRGISIPVFFRSGENLSPISTEDSVFTAVVLLVDSNMVIDNEWDKYINQLLAVNEKFPKKFMLYPIAIERNAFNLKNSLLKKNFIRSYEHDNDWIYIASMLTHEFCRLLYNVKRINEEDKNSRANGPVKLFISHAKEDGVNFAKSLCSFISAETPLKTFFDANDIAFGYDFPQEIESHINKSVFVAIHTDKYSSREWCRREVVLAKKHNRPMVLINLFNEGESRSFPYMANVKTIRINQKGNKKNKNFKIILFTLAETLRFKYHEMFMDYLVRKLPIPAKERNIFSYPPELLTLFSGLVQDEKYIIYPDPPLSQEEIDILNLANHQIQYITPTMLPAVNKVEIENDISGSKIGLSISEVEEMHQEGYGKIHLRDALVEVSRYLLASGYQLAYGGDVRYNSTFNFAQLLFDLARTYNKAQIKPFEKIDNYLAYPLCAVISKKEKGDLQDIVNLIDVIPTTCTSRDPYKVYDAKTAADKVIWSISLTKMRTAMNKNISARVIIGGKIRDFKGKYPGVFEEAYISLMSGTPTFVIGGFGGAASVISGALLGEQREELTEDFYTKNEEYKRFFDLFNLEAALNDYESINFLKLQKLFNEKGVAGLHNGLTLNENNILFQSKNLSEIIGLIFTGLGRLSI